MSKNILKAISIVFAIFLIANVIYRYFKADKNASKNKPFKSYVLFDSTFRISTPFPLKNETTKEKGPVKVNMTTYDSENIHFMLIALNCLSLVDTNRRVLTSNILKGMDSVKKRESKVNSIKQLVINGRAFSQFEGTCTPKERRSFEDYQIINFQLLYTRQNNNFYLIYFDENIDNAEVKEISKRVFNSINIANK